MAKNLTDIYVGVKKDDEKRREHDFYGTPPLAAYVLHKYTQIPYGIIEPCAGRGNLSVEFQRLGYDVLSFDLNDHHHKLTDIHAHQDVMELGKFNGYDAFITNPPYFKNLPHKIAQKGIDEYDYTALFVRLTFLEGQKRKVMFDRYPPSDILFMSDRVNFKEHEEEPITMKDQIGGMIAYCWIVWNKKATHQNTKLKWVLLKEEYEEWSELHGFRQQSNDLLSHIL